MKCKNVCFDISLKNILGRSNVIIKGHNGAKKTRIRITDNYELWKSELVRFHCILTIILWCMDDVAR
jgi:hypothetical protein